MATNHTARRGRRVVIDDDGKPSHEGMSAAEAREELRWPDWDDRTPDDKAREAEEDRMEMAFARAGRPAPERIDGKWVPQESADDPEWVEVEAGDDEEGSPTHDLAATKPPTDVLALLAPPKDRGDALTERIKAMAAAGMTKAAIARQVGLCRRQVYRRLNDELH